MSLMLSTFASVFVTAFAIILVRVLCRTHALNESRAEIFSKWLNPSIAILIGFILIARVIETVTNSAGLIIDVVINSALLFSFYLLFESLLGSSKSKFSKFSIFFRERHRNAQDSAKLKSIWNLQASPPPNKIMLDVSHIFLIIIVSVAMLALVFVVSINLYIKYSEKSSAELQNRINVLREELRANK